MGSKHRAGTGVSNHTKKIRGRAGGKPVFTRTVLASAVALALAEMTAIPVMAATCPSPTISSPTGAITLGSGCSVSVTSTGSVTGGPGTDGIVVSTTGVAAGNITNSGTISGASGIIVGGGSKMGSITNNAGGTITGSGTISGIGIGISSSSHATGGISNSGTVSGTSAGIRLTGGSTLDSGITNSGLITGGNAGILLWSGSTINGGITNNAGGIISGTGTGSSAGGITLTNSSTVSSISNSGTITGENGILLKSGSSITNGITNNAGGTITGTSGNGILVSSNSTVDSITNNGTINATGSGIAIWSSSSVTGNIVNNGTINAGASGIGIWTSSSVTGKIVNNGTISAPYGIGVADSSNVAGGIFNNGTINGGSTGFYISYSTVNGGLHNTGTISAGTEGGIYILNSSTIGGGITNSGSISGSTTGIRILTASGVSGGLNNSGTISGGQYAVYVDGTSTLDAINISGANTAQFIGDVVAPNTPVTVTGGSTFTATNAFNVQSFAIGSGATFNMGAMPSTGGGSAGLTVSNGVSNDGTLAVPAGATATITGNYTQSANGVFETGVASTTSYGKLNVTGTADLTASNKIAVNVASSPTLAVGDTLSGVLTAGTLNAGALTVTDNSALFNFTAAVNGNSVDLTTQQGISAASAVASTGWRSAAGAATVFDSLINGSATPSSDMSTVITDLGQLTTEAQVSNAISQTLPVLEGSMARVSLDNLQSIGDVVRHRQQANRGLSSGDDFADQGGVWLKPLGAWADQKTKNGAYGYSAKTYGIMAGADTSLGSDNTRIGAAFAYSHSNVDSKSNVQSARVDSYLGVLYGSQSLGTNTTLRLQADYGRNANNSNRRMPFAGRKATGDYSSFSYHAGAALDYRMQLDPQTTLTPSLSADYTKIHSNGYSETGAGALNLSVKSQNVDQLILAARGTLSHHISDNIALSADLGAGYDPMAKSNSIVSSFEGGGAAFSTSGVKPGHFLALGGVAMTAKLRPEALGGQQGYVTVRYNISIRSHSSASAQGVSLEFRMPLW